MEVFPNELSSRIQQLESRLLEPSLKVEFSMLVGELVLSLKTLEIELKAERTKSEAMRHNLRALATASASNSGRTQESPRGITGAYKKTAQSPRERYLENSGELNLQYKNYRHASSPRSSMGVDEFEQRPPYLDQRARSNTTSPGQLPTARLVPPVAAPPKSPLGSSPRQAQVSIKEKERIGAIFTDAVPRGQDMDSLDPVDSFDLDDIHIDSPFDAAPGPTSLPLFPSKINGEKLLDAETTSAAVAASFSSQPSASVGSVAHPTPSPRGSPRILNVSSPNTPTVAEKSHIETKSASEVESTEDLTVSATFSSSRDSIRKSDSAVSVYVPMVATTPETKIEESLTAEFVLEALQQALMDGTRQKIELERSRRQLIVQNMQAPSPSTVAQPSSSDSPRKDVITPPVESKPTARKMSLKRMKSKIGSLFVSHPIGLRVGSYRAEQDEFERIFCLSQDFINPPSPAQRADESNLSDALKRRLGILKDALDYDADFSGCDIFALYGFVLDYVCKSLRLNLSNNRITEIPSQLRKFDKLEELILTNNAIVRVPGAVAHLRSLRCLRFSNNMVCDIPMEVGYLTQLEILDLAENQISEVPKHIGLLHSLRYFNISKNPIQVLPSELSLCSKLTHLIASTCFLKKIPKELVALADLEVLDVSHNHIKELPAGIGFLTKMRTLRIADNNLTELPIGLGLCTTLLNDGEFLHSNNPWNPKSMSAVLNDEQPMTDWLTQRAQQQQKAVSKLTIPQLPKVPTIPAYKPITVDTERWTLQEKIVCCGDWVTNTLDKYLRPALSAMSTVLSNVTEVDSPQLLKLLYTLKQVTTLVWRSEDLLKPAPFATSRSFDDDVPLHQIRAIVNSELLNLDAIMRSLVPIIRSAAISEKLEDTVTVVNVVHFARDLLFILVLDEARGVTVPTLTLAGLTAVSLTTSALASPSLASPLSTPTSASLSSSLSSIPPRSPTTTPTTFQAPHLAHPTATTSASPSIDKPASPRVVVATVTEATESDLSSSSSTSNPPQDQMNREEPTSVEAAAETEAEEPDAEPVVNPASSSIELSDTASPSDSN